MIGWEGICGSGGWGGGVVVEVLVVVVVVVVVVRGACLNCSLSLPLTGPGPMPRLAKSCTRKGSCLEDARETR